MTEPSENQNKSAELLDSEAIGKFFSLSERSVDVLLESYGFQSEVRVPGLYGGYCYAPTKSKGSQHCDTLKIDKFTDESQLVYRPLWRQTILETLKAYL